MIKHAMLAIDVTRNCINLQQTSVVM